ncbi:MAG: hypothetical protein AABY97_07750, partial [Chloroflexota bacterium]
MILEPDEGSADDPSLPEEAPKEHPAEGAPQPEKPTSIPNRHPTGSPGLTGGWMAEGFEPDPANPPDEPAKRTDQVASTARPSSPRSSSARVAPTAPFPEGSFDQEDSSTAPEEPPDLEDTQPSALTGSHSGSAPPSLGELPRRVPERDHSAT